MVMNIYYLIEKSTAIFKQQKNILDNINKMNRALPYRIQHLLNFPYVALKSKVHWSHYVRQAVQFTGL